MRIWFPYVASAFMFIWMMNLIGFIPLPFSSEKVSIAGLELPKLQIYAATANLSVTLTLTPSSVPPSPLASPSAKAATPIRAAHDLGWPYWRSAAAAARGAAGTSSRGCRTPGISTKSRPSAREVPPSARGRTAPLICGQPCAPP